MQVALAWYVGRNHLHDTGHVSRGYFGHSGEGRHLVSAGADEGGAEIRKIHVS